MAKRYGCPACGSEDTARLSAVHAHGSSEIKGGAVGLDSGGGLAVADFSGTSTTAAAKRASPPPKKDEAWPAIIVLVCSVLLIALLASAPFVFGDGPVDHGVIAAWAFFLICVGVPLALAIFAWRGNARYNAKEWRLLHAAWSNRWTCRRCGEVFRP